MRATISHVFAFSGGVFFLLLALHPAGARAQTQAPPAATDPFADRSWHLELALHSGVEAWNYNRSREEMYGLSAGLTYGLINGLVFTARAPLYYVSQRGTDAMLFGTSIGVRGRVYRHRRVSLFLEIDVGISEADIATPPRGTRFNYLALGGAGATITVRNGLHLLASMRWAHVSNGGLAGRDRNPDIEMIGLQVGVLVGF
jgi:Lipid A 3-O-deacylase (PagL)